jgi:hypothetical protein
MLLPERSNGGNKGLFCDLHVLGVRTTSKTAIEHSGATSKWQSTGIAHSKES